VVAAMTSSAMIRATTYHSISLLIDFDTKQHLRKLEVLEKLIDPTYRDASATVCDTG